MCVFFLVVHLQAHGNQIYQFYSCVRTYDISVCLCACVSYNPGFKGWFHFSLLQQDPVNLSEEGMGLDGLLTALVHHAAQTFGRILGHELHTNTQYTL